MVDLAYFSQLSYCNLVACMSTKGELFGIQLKPECFMGRKGQVIGCKVGERMIVEG